MHHFHPYKLKHACLTRPFIEGATQKGQRKEHCMCIKQKQNISSQSFLRSPSTLKSSFQFVWFQRNRRQNSKRSGPNYSSLPAMRSNSAAFSLEEFSIETISSSLLKTTVWCAGIGDSLPVIKK